MQYLAGRKLSAQFLKVLILKLFVVFVVFHNQRHSVELVDDFDLVVPFLKAVQYRGYDQNYEPFEIVLRKVIPVQQRQSAF